MIKAEEFPETVTIEVTQDDINQGVKKAPCECPIAWAAKRTFGVERVLVYFGNVIMRRNGLFYEYELPHGAITFMKQFDNDAFFSPEPFSFVMKLKEDKIKDLEWREDKIGVGLDWI